MKRILIVEDNAELAFGLRNNLEIEGYAIDVATDGQAGLDAALQSPPDLMILDFMLPKLDGFRVLRSIRDAGLTLPILILTAKGDESEKVRGLKMGADDYVTKPFALLELLARVEAVLRRGAPAVERRIGSFGDVIVDFASRTVTKRGEAVSLSRKEFDLLAALLEKENVVVPRLDLMRAVWGYADSVITRTIDTHIAELRRKLEDNPRMPEHILTAPTIGYRLKRG
ncbi:MAG TPA: response regulator transcription factor [Thermoanaerobaculia bacterium]|jgi:two-component system alkaline phosphatase synthesis response regulator PhoP|nr:response regulator transcription factor [Thermoanaerobaculia bacterium]